MDVGWILNRFLIDGWMDVGWIFERWVDVG